MAAPVTRKLAEQARRPKLPSGWSYWGSSGYGYENIHKSNPKIVGLKNWPVVRKPASRA